MNILTAMDGTLIVVEHITTVNYRLNKDLYEADSLAHFRGKKDVEEAGDAPEYQKQLQDALDKRFPKGRPDYSNYFKTRVGLSDGTSHWVNASRDHVVALLMAG